MVVNNLKHKIKYTIIWTLLILISFACSQVLANQKNIILMIGDGMGPEQIKAAVYYQGSEMTFQDFPYQGQISTYSANSSVTDSAAAATAMATGEKVNNGVISLQIPGDNRELETLLEYYKSKGKRTGLVTSAYITHATPAAFGAHESSRSNYTSIATDYLNQTKPYILFGGGSNGITISSAENAGYTIVTTLTELQLINTESAPMISGQFGNSHLPYEYDGLGSLPHLSNMTESALAVLDNDPDGFFIMIECGRIDHACHSNDLKRSIHEVIEFSNTVQKVLNWAANRNDTLIIVTADHETGGLTVVSDNGAGNYPSVTWGSTGHTGEDVPVYAWGINANLFTGMMNNTYLPITIKEAGEIDPPPSAPVNLRIRVIF